MLMTRLCGLCGVCQSGQHTHKKNNFVYSTNTWPNAGLLMFSNLYMSRRRGPSLCSNMNPQPQNVNDPSIFTVMMMMMTEFHNKLHYTYYTLATRTGWRREPTHACVCTVYSYIANAVINLARC